MIIEALTFNKIKYPIGILNRGIFIPRTKKDFIPRLACTPLAEKFLFLKAFQILLMHCLPQLTNRSRKLKILRPTNNRMKIGGHNPHLASTLPVLDRHQLEGIIT